MGGEIIAIAAIHCSLESTFMDTCAPKDRPRSPIFFLLSFGQFLKVDNADIRSFCSPSPRSNLPWLSPTPLKLNLIVAIPCLSSNSQIATISGDDMSSPNSGWAGANTTPENGLFTFVGIVTMPSKESPWDLNVMLCCLIVGFVGQNGPEKN